MAANQVIEYASQCGDLNVCTAIAYDPNPPTDDSKASPLKEYLIKFSVMNDKKPLILDYKTFVESTGLDYAKGTYVSHPSPKVVKAELAKIVENLILLDRTPVLKTTFPVAWRILFTFVVQVLDGNYSSTEQVNSIQQLIAYYLLTGTKVDIGEIIYNDLDPSKFTPIELTAFMVAVNNREHSVTLLPFTVKKKKRKSQTMTSTLPQSQGPKASGSLPQKRKKPKSKKTPTKTKVTSPPKPMKGSEQSHSVSSTTVPNPQDPARNIQLAEGNIQFADKGFPSMVSNEGTVKTTSLPEGPLGDKDSEGNKTPVDMEPINLTVADLSWTGAKLTEDQWEKHEEAAVSYADPRASIEGY
ncbi:hypothetical protein Tco_0449401 [Tanacetum coccineum]